MSVYKRNMKIVVLGDSNVGKTTLIHRYMKNDFTQYQFQTVGVDFVFRDYICPNTNNNYCVYIWDTAGQERFHTLVSQFYRGSDGAIICFDISNRTSFQSITKWINEIRTYSPEVQIILCGTKGDLLDRNNISIPRAVSIDEATYLAESLKCSYIETSSRDGSNINNLFDVIINHVIDFGAVNSTNDDNTNNNGYGSSNIRLTNKKHRDFHNKIMPKLNIPKSSKNNIILASSNNKSNNSNNSNNNENEILIDMPELIPDNMTYPQAIRNKLSNITSYMSLSTFHCNIL